VSITKYEAYVRTEWELFRADPIRARVFLDATADVEARRVLDVGCGSGQELIPYVQRGAVSIGLDVAEEAGRAGRELFTQLGRPSAVAFLRGTVETLPFRDGSFDVVICRLVLPYVDNSRSLAEMIRVLRPRGVLLLQCLSLANYLDDLVAGVKRRSARSVLGAIRVMVAGTLHHLLGRQVRVWPFGSDTFQSEWLLRREIERAGGAIERRLPAERRGAPRYRIVKL
jgi:SAM-dependent methyltransferase